MRRESRVGLLVLALGLGWAGGPARVAGDSPSGEAEFLAGLESARKSLASGKAAEGLRTTERLLEAHRGRDYVRAKRADVEDLVRRLSFAKECPPPDPASLVHGTLERFTSKTGEIRIRYAAGKEDDFRRDERGGLVFPARFSGPFEVSVRGRSYPDTTQGSPAIQVGMEEDERTRRRHSWTVLFGVPPYDTGSRQVWLPAKILHCEGDDQTTLVEKETSPARPGKPFRIEVTVARQRISAAIDGKSIGGGPKPDGVFGFLRVEVHEWDEIAIAGQVEPSWLQSKIDAMVDRQRAEFEERFDARRVLPPWLYEEGPPEGDVEAEGDGDDDPDEDPVLARTPAAYREAVLTVLATLAREEFAEALEEIAGVRQGAEDGMTPLLDVLAARAHLGLGDVPKALSALDHALAAAPGFPEALSLKASVLLRTGREDEAAAAIEASTASPNAPRSAFVAAAVGLLVLGRLHAAPRVTELAARRGRGSPVLDVLAGIFVKAADGPSWTRRHEYSTSNFRVCSDIDVETCRQAALLLEEALTTYRVHVRPLKAEKPRLYRVYLFSGRAGFQRYLEDVLPFEGRVGENAAGLYSGLLKQLLIWNLPSRDDMMRTVRHEGFHQYLDRLLPDPPVWFNEGLAVYYEAHERIAGQTRLDAPRRDLLRVLSEKGLRPLSEFLRWRPSRFYAGGIDSYAQAWLLVHMLRHGAAKHRDLFSAFLRQLETRSALEATDAVFPESSLGALDAALRAHLEVLTAAK